jgi:hypothetical protein
MDMKLHTLKMFENRMLRKLLRPRREDLMEGWRKVRTENNRWGGNVTRMEEIKNANEIFVWKTGSGDQDVGRRILLKCILKYRV